MQIQSAFMSFVHFIFACTLELTLAAAQRVCVRDGKTTGFDCLSRGGDEILISGGERAIRQEKIVLESDTRMPKSSPLPMTAP
jgi:hypothetical protein